LKEKKYLADKPQNSGKSSYNEEPSNMVNSKYMAAQKDRG
jgi:hypothetical protein